MARKQPPALAAAERLQPTAAPVASFVNPGTPGGGLADVMKSLAGLNPTLDAMANRWAKDEAESQSALAEKKIAGMTFEDAKAAVKGGQLHEFSSPWFRAAFEKQYGIRAAHEARRQAEEALATQDLSEVDPDEWSAQFAREAAADLGDSKWTTAGFVQGLDGLTDRVRDKVNADRIARTVEARQDNAYQNFLGTIENMVGTVAPEQMAAVVREQMRQNRDLLGLSYRDQDKVFGEVLKTLAQRPGMEPVIAQLGTLDRDNGVTISTKLGPTFEAIKATAEARTLEERRDAIQEDLLQFTLKADAGDMDEEAFRAWAAPQMEAGVLSGGQVASFITRNQDAKRAAEARAVAALQDTAKDAYVASISPQLADLARTGKVAEAQDLKATVYGKEVELTAKEVKELALTQAAKQIEAEGQAQRLDPIAVRKNVVAMYGQNGEVDPASEARIEAFLHATSTPGDIPQTALDYLPELAAVNEAAPHMVDRIAASEDHRMFIDTVTVGLDLGLSPQEALRTAVWRRDNKQLIALPKGKDRSALVDGITDSLDGRGAFLGFGGDKIASRALLDRFVNERVDYYYATGATGRKLQKLVTDSFMRTHAYMNGQLVDVTGTGLPPSRALPILKDAADAIKEAKPAYASDDITFVPLRRGSGNFMAVTSTGLPIPGTQRTWEEMTQLHSRRRTTRLQSKAGQPTLWDNFVKAAEAMARPDPTLP